MPFLSPEVKKSPQPVTCRKRERGYRYLKKSKKKKKKKKKKKRYPNISVFFGFHFVFFGFSGTRGNFPLRKNFIVPVVHHTVLFFLFPFNLFYSFAFLLFGGHATRVGSVEKQDTEPPVRCPFSGLSMKTVSQVIPGLKKSLNCGRRKTTRERKKSFFCEVCGKGGSIKHYEKTSTSISQASLPFWFSPQKKTKWTELHRIGPNS